MAERSIYSLSVEDIHTVSEEIIGRKPTKKEVQFVKEGIGDRIVWFDIIEGLLNEYNEEPVLTRKVPKK